MNIETLKTRLINAGYKVTKQREVIFEALFERNSKQKRSGNWYSYGL